MTVSWLLRVCTSAVIGRCAGCGGGSSDDACLRDVEERTVEIALNTPDTGRSVTLDEVVCVEREVWVVSTVHFRGYPVTPVITFVSDQVVLAVPPYPQCHFVVGKTWQWENHEDIVFIESRDDIGDTLDDGTLLYERA